MSCVLRSPPPPTTTPTPLHVLGRQMPSGGFGTARDPGAALLPPPSSVPRLHPERLSLGDTVGRVFRSFLALEEREKQKTGSEKLERIMKGGWR